MQLGKILIVAGLIAVGILSLSFKVLAVEPPDDEGLELLPPEYWAVIVIDCRGAGGLTIFTTVRVKKVVDCEVETQAISIPMTSGSCDNINQEFIKTWMLQDATIFGETGFPGIYKIQNWKQEVDESNNPINVWSFDGLIRFWKPSP